MYDRGRGCLLFLNRNLYNYITLSGFPVIICDVFIDSISVSIYWIINKIWESGCFAGISHFLLIFIVADVDACEVRLVVELNHKVESIN